MVNKLREREQSVINEICEEVAGDNCSFSDDGGGGVSVFAPMQYNKDTPAVRHAVQDRSRESGTSVNQ
jgi:hypothetical protein